jgi:hypothetical protein
MPPLFHPRNHVHHFRLTSLAEIDAEFESFLREAYAVGDQRHLQASSRAPIAPATST